MKIEDIINDYYKDENKKSISKEQLLQFLDEYMLIKELKEKYNSKDCNRKEVGLEILERVGYLKSLLRIFSSDLLSDKTLYEFPEYITDYKTVLELLVKLANTAGNDYVLKEFKFDIPGIYDSLRSDEEKSVIHNGIWVIGEKEAIDQINDKKGTKPVVIQSKLARLINSGYSMILCTDYIYYWHILPSEYGLGQVKKTSFRANDLSGDISCYTYDDKLDYAVEKVFDYIRVYGGNVSGLTVDDIIDRINNIENEKPMTLSRTSNNSQI